ncbi:hypothetical protein [Haliea sp. E17]|uniref:hypothetical protein n=1 Tax=Haliea sp. E17 TaxID=3401576 RepID=UPI003AAC28CE
MLCQQLLWGGLRLAAEWQALPASARMDWWSEWEVEPSEAEWQREYRRLQAALRLMPDDPALQAELGDLYTWRLGMEGLSNDQTFEAMDAGAQAYMASLSQRPTWVGDWDDLALILYNQRLYADADYQLALRQMARLGSRRGDMMDLLAELSASSWQALDTETRTMVVGATDVLRTFDVREGLTVADISR